MRQLAVAEPGHALEQSQPLGLRLIELSRGLTVAYPGTIRFRLLTQETGLLRWEASLPDNLVPGSEPTPQLGRDWYVTARMTNAQLVGTMLAAVLAFAEHEIRESFTILGQRPYHPYH